MLGGKNEGREWEIDRWIYGLACDFVGVWVLDSQMHTKPLS